MTPCKQCGWPYGVGTDGLCENCTTLKNHPDKLSKRKVLNGMPFEDMKQLDETERITLIISHLTTNPGRKIAVMVDTGEGQ